MSLRIQMLGTGSAFAKSYFNNNAILHANGRSMLLDCGNTAPRSLHQLGIEPSDIDCILITHLHADHVGGLEEFAFRLKYTYRKKIPLYVPFDLVKPLWEHTLKGGLENHVEGLTQLDDYFEVRPLEECRPAAVLDGLQVELYRTQHVVGKPSFSLFINDSFFYSSDVRFDRQLFEYVLNERKCKSVFQDCDLRGSGIVHASLEQLLTLPEHMQRRIYLMHYGEDGIEMNTYKGKTGSMQFVEQHRSYDLTALGI